MLKKNEFVNLMSLKSVKGLGNKRVIQLIEHFGDSSIIFSSRDFKPFSFVTKDVMNDLRNTIRKNSERFETAYEYCIKNKIDIISYFDKEYPEKLKAINYPPLVLFLKGNGRLLDSEMISVVGSRKSSAAALEYAFDISEKLSEKGYVITSGGAFGIDAAAHRGALQCSGKTICILPSGLGNLYPKANIEIFNNIEKKGLLVSEYIPSKKTDRFSLLERNRITSGLSDNVFMVTSSTEGGAMAQFKHAYEQKKNIFCPARKLEPFDGIAKLISERKIIPVKDADDLLDKIKRIGKSSQMNLFSVEKQHNFSRQMISA